MSFNFYVGSLVSRINLAVSHKKLCITERKSPISEKILYLLVDKHIINHFIVTKTSYIIFLKYGPNKSIIRNLKIISKPNKRIFVNVYKLNSIVNLNSCSFFILSTTSGLFFERDCLRLNLGGELLFSINF